MRGCLKRPASGQGMGKHFSTAPGALRPAPGSGSKPAFCCFSSCIGRKNLVFST